MGMLRRMRLIAKRCTTTLVTLPTEWESPVGGRGFAQQESQLVFGQQELTQAKVSQPTVEPLTIISHKKLWFMSSQ